MSKFRWLIFEETQATHESRALKVLNSSDISVDAEITYLNLNERLGNEYELYDVYNNAYSLGGQINIERESSLITNWNETILTDSMRAQVAKYLYRNKLSDVTARVGVVVMQFAKYF